MQKNCLFSILFSFTLLYACVGLRGKTFRLYSPVRTKRGYPHTISTGFADNKMSCATLCSRKKICDIFKYQDDGICSLYYDLDSRFFVMHEEGSEVYLNTAAQPVMFHKPCTEDSQCLISNSLCHNRKCTCQIGYSYTRGINTCSIGCKKYGHSFTKFGLARIRLTASNEKTRKYQTLSDAKRECWGSPQCRGIGQTKDGNKIQYVGWFDVSPSSRMYNVTDSAGHALFIRHCSENLDPSQ